MILQRGSQLLRKQLQASAGIAKLAMRNRESLAAFTSARWFSESRRLMAVKPVLLADIGEGIVECEVIQWFVEPGASVEEFAPLCEVQSDKASVEITSRFAGTVKKLYYEAGEMARVGKPFVDIEVRGGDRLGSEKSLAAPEPGIDQGRRPEEATRPAKENGEEGEQARSNLQPLGHPKPKGRMASLATPAVRHLSKEHNVDIAHVEGSGRDGRVHKEDIMKFVKAKAELSSPSHPAPSSSSIPSNESSAQIETRTPLTHTQQQMFKSMTRSLKIPHFLYADEIDFTSLVELRARFNKVLAKSPAKDHPAKLSYLPFIIKAVSMALLKYPILNARVDIEPETQKPSLIMRSQHNIGVAMDTPQGLIVPVIKNVASLNILSIASELARLQTLADQGKLAPSDLTGGTITVSNIGNLGGTYLSPVVVEKEVSILGIGRMRTVPAFNEKDEIVKKQICNFSWSADHRVVDGATMAKGAEMVRSVVEEPDIMAMHLR